MRKPPAIDPKAALGTIINPTMITARSGRIVKLFSMNFGKNVANPAIRSCTKVEENDTQR